MENILNKIQNLSDEEKEQIQQENEKALLELRSLYRKVEIFSLIIGFVLSSFYFKAAFTMNSPIGILGGLLYSVIMFVIAAGIPWGWIKVAGKMSLLNIFLIGFFIQLILSAFVGWFFLLKYWFKERKDIF